MKHYDKIFFLASLIVLGASCGYYFINAPAIDKTAKKATALLQQSAAGIEWKNVTVPEFKVQQIEWPEVRPQDNGGKWFFQVFTPPQIWVDNDGKFITESPYIKEQARQAFALKYGGVSNEPYPVKYVGFMGDPKDPIIQLKNDDTKEFYSGKINKPIMLRIVSKNGLAKDIDTGLMIKSFSSQRVKKSDNTIYTEVKLVLTDKKYGGKQIEILSNKQTVIADSRRMTFVLPADAQWHVRKVGESKSVAGATYTVESIDFDAGKALVKMTPDNKEIEPQLMELSNEGVKPFKKVKK